MDPQNSFSWTISLHSRWFAWRCPFTFQLFILELWAWSGEACPHFPDSPSPSLPTTFLRRKERLSQEVVVKVAHLWEELASRWLALCNAMQRGGARAICRAGLLPKERALAWPQVFTATKKVHMLTTTISLFKFSLKTHNQNKISDKNFILSHNWILSFRSTSKPKSYSSWNCFQDLCSEMSIYIPYMGLLSSLLPKFCGLAPKYTNLWTVSRNVSVCSCPRQQHSGLPRYYCWLPTTTPDSSSLAISLPHSTSWIMKKKLTGKGRPSKQAWTYFICSPSLMYGFFTNICCGSWIGDGSHVCTY